MERNGVEEIERKKEEVIKETNSRKGKKRKGREENDMEGKKGKEGMARNCSERKS